ncbi:MAG: glycosyltransferase [Nitrospira sp.]|nr:glycosyltransferase [Nitrospira sp.]
MNSDSQPLVSVLTPVYNCENYLAECIESVLAQTYRNWEYCIVNNCSTDGTLEIAERYAKKDHRIRIHNNQEFVGIGQNGNIAFQQMSPGSKYCKVVFADDWLFPECIMKMVELAEVHPTVAIVGSYGLVGETVSWAGLPYTSMVIPGRDISRWTLLGRPYVFGNPTSILLRSDVVRESDPFYDEANSHRDSEACLRILRKWDFGFIHQVLTYNRLREGSGRSFSQRYNTHLPNYIDRLLKFGPAVLNQEELHGRLTHYLSKYYDYLALSVFMRREKEFWAFHREKMKDIGQPLSLLKLGTAVCVKVMDCLLNPKRTVEGLLKKLR